MFDPNTVPGIFFSSTEINFVYFELSIKLKYIAKGSKNEPRTIKFRLAKLTMNCFNDVSINERKIRNF